MGLSHLRPECQYGPQLFVSLTSTYQASSDEAPAAAQPARVSRLGLSRRPTNCPGPTTDWDHEREYRLLATPTSISIEDGSFREIKQVKTGGGALEDVSTVALRAPSVTSSREEEPEPSSMRDDFNTATMSGSDLVA